MSSPQVLAIIPVRGRDAEANGDPVILGGMPLIAHTIDAALRCPAIGRTVVTTDSPTIRDIALNLGAEAPFLRPEELSAPGVPLSRVFQHCLEYLEQSPDYRTDIVVSLETSHPIRPDGLLEQVVGMLEDQKLDTVFTVYEERHAFWQIDDYGELVSIGGEGATPRSERRPMYREVAGLALACRASLTREGIKYGSRIGVVPIRDTYALVDTQDPIGLVLAEHLLAIIVQEPIPRLHNPA